MNLRIFIEKKRQFDIESTKLLNQLQEIVPNLTKIKAYPFYEVFGIEEVCLEKAIQNIFSNPVTDLVHLHELPSNTAWSFALEYLPGQYDQRADSAEQCLQLIGIENVRIKTAVLYQIDGVSEQEMTKIKKFLLNPIEKREKDMSRFQLAEDTEVKAVLTHRGFIDFSEQQLQDFYIHQAFSLGFDDLVFIQTYFQSVNRNPTETELKVLDTYWSDHCRHTTFETEITRVKIESKFTPLIQKYFDEYIALRQEMGITKPIRLMDLATIMGKYLVKTGVLHNLDVSEEINACSIVVPIFVDGKEEEWLLQFKNETHNHPTEVEPFGGASTCIGGAIRDPLSGRAFVFQAMRITGSGNPLEEIGQTLEGKLPQKKITTEAAHGYSSYGNQIGLATTLVREIYDEGYKAKRMEVGFVAGAVKKDWVQREIPNPGDKVIILGGKTGRDGVGGATGSSKTHDGQNIDDLSAEVQKGNAIVERKIQRLFKKEEVIRLIKRCNDFGAGGVSVAIGEIADGVHIYLDKLPKKYLGLNGTELALSESQERMAIVVSAAHVGKFIQLAQEENLEAVEIATVTQDKRLVMEWEGKQIVNLDRSFLDTSGVRKKATVKIIDGEGNCPFSTQPFSAERFKSQLIRLNSCSQKGMIELFDSNIGRGTVLMPLGGVHQDTPERVSVQKFPTTGFTNHVSMATYGFQPDISKWSSFHGGYYAVVESVANIVAAGGDYKEIRLTFQEYFERLREDAKRWGKPFAALLGTLLAQKEFQIAAIGGKDSMSGSYKNLDVPPTLISFAVCPNLDKNIISGTLQQQDSYLYALIPTINSDFIIDTPRLKQQYEALHELIKNQEIRSSRTIHLGGIAETLVVMSMGNEIGMEINTELDLAYPFLGGIVIESKIELDASFVSIGRTKKSKQITINEIEFDLLELKSEWKKPLQKVFPEKIDSTEIGETRIIQKNQKKGNTSPKKTAQPLVFIPVFPGTNSEYDSQKAFEREGASVNSLVFKNQTIHAINDSVCEFADQINQCQILFLPGGFSAADEPEGSGKFIATILRNEKIKESIHALLERDGLILGICNGFQALIKSGLLPYGEIKELMEDSPTLTYNQIGRHISQIARIKVTETHSPWLSGMQGKTFAIPFSHGEGRFMANENKIEELIQNGQIATQYVDLNGNHSLEMPYNPNGSVFGIEGITSKCGKIYGRMGHPERVEEGLMKNIPNIEYMNIFKNGVQYFK